MDKKMLLWLDDNRNPFLNKEGKVPQISDDTHIVWVLNHNEFVEWVTANGLPTLISFDHDLADEHYTPEQYWGSYKESKAYQDKVSIDYIEKTGYDTAKWLCEYCMENNVKLPEFYVHSANPVGADNIRYYLNNYKKHCE